VTKDAQIHVYLAAGGGSVLFRREQRRFGRLFGNRNFSNRIIYESLDRFIEFPRYPSLEVAFFLFA